MATTGTRGRQIMDLCLHILVLLMCFFSLQMDLLLLHTSHLKLTFLHRLRL